MESRNLVRLFHAMNNAKKPSAGAEPRDVRRLAVLGAGFMGAGVASVSLGQCPVVLKDISDETLSAGIRTVEKGLAAQTRSGAITRRELNPMTQAGYQVGLDVDYEYVSDDNKCIGCGFCADTCPCGIWAMNPF